MPKRCWLSKAFKWQKCKWKSDTSKWNDQLHYKL